MLKLTNGSDNDFTDKMFNQNQYSLVWIIYDMLLKPWEILYCIDKSVSQKVFQDKLVTYHSVITYTCLNSWIMLSNSWKIFWKSQNPPQTISNFLGRDKGMKSLGKPVTHYFVFLILESFSENSWILVKPSVISYCKAHYYMMFENLLSKFPCSNFQGKFTNFT